MLHATNLVTNVLRSSRQNIVLQCMSVRSVLVKYWATPNVQIGKVFNSLHTCTVLGECSHCMHMVGQFHANVPTQSRPLQQTPTSIN